MPDNGTMVVVLGKTRSRDLAIVIDEYKLHHRRRFITYEEILSVMTDLGYRKES